MIRFQSWIGWQSIHGFQCLQSLRMEFWFFGGKVQWKVDLPGIGEEGWHFGTWVWVYFRGLECSAHCLNWCIIFIIYPFEIISVRTLDQVMDLDHQVFGSNSLFWANFREFTIVDLRCFFSMIILQVLFPTRLIMTEKSFKTVLWKHLPQHLVVVFLLKI